MTADRTDVPTQEDVRIDIYSDVVCPWCYVGKRRLERALSVLGSRVQVAWRPFQLNPTMSPEGMDRRAYLEEKFGSLEAFEQIEGPVVAAGAEEGIEFAFEKIQRTPNTLPAHRLIWQAGRQGRQDAVVNELFRCFFEQGQDIGRPAVLAEAAARAGLDRAETDRFLAGESGLREVREEEAVGHRLGIRSVPYFVFNGAYGLSGAHPPARFVAALQRVAADAATRKAGA